MVFTHALISHTSWIWLKLLRRERTPSLLRLVNLARPKGVRHERRSFRRKSDPESPAWRCRPGGNYIGRRRLTNGEYGVSPIRAPRLPAPLLRISEFPI